ncbi:uncharacterized protein [Engystomops pustulosus]|uniref:uncharacterized protein isoform X1 n=1 Tax=Engystomops pustulosus TaxID=76066 RepID=UPI003AFB068D
MTPGIFLQSQTAQDLLCTEGPTVDDPCFIHKTTTKRIQKPSTDGHSSVPNTTTNMQGNVQGNQNQNSKPKFSCSDCTFTCNSSLNYRIHLQNIHHKTNEEAQKMSALNQEDHGKGQAAPNIQPAHVPSTSGGNIAKFQDNNAVPKLTAAAIPSTSVMVQDNKAVPKPITKEFQSFAVKATIVKPAVVRQDTDPGHLSVVQQLEGYTTEKSTVNTQPAQENQKGKAPANIQPAVPIVGGRKLKDYISRVDREPLIGLEYVLEYCCKTRSQIETRYFCELCECDTLLDPMVEHLAGFGHRKLYLAKEYPYVLKAQSNSKEDQSLFIRRMALEIEREEGTKKHMVDVSLWMETMMTLRTADKKMKKKTRWDDDKNDEKRMKKALTFLETFEIESEIEATTVTRLCEKLTANLKFYNTKTKEDALFPARVARAHEVALEMVQNAARQRTPFQNPIQQTSKPQMASRPPGFPENTNFKNKFGMPAGFPGKNFQNVNTKQNMPHIPRVPSMQGPPPMNPLQGPPLIMNPMQGPPLIMNPMQGPPPIMNPMQGPAPMNPMQGHPPMNPMQGHPRMNPMLGPPPMNPMQGPPPMNPMQGNPQKSENTVDIANVAQDTQFFKKLVTLLDAIPQTSSPSDNTQMNSKLLMLKSLLVNQKNIEQEQANQKLMAQITNMVQETISAQNASLNQQLMMMMSAQNSTAMGMQTAPPRNNLMAANNVQLNGNPVMGGAAVVPGIPSSVNMQTNMNSVMPFNQDLESQAYGQMGGTTVDQNTYPAQQDEIPNLSTTSQSYDNFGYGNSVDGKYLAQGTISQQVSGNTLTIKKNEQTPGPYTDVGYESSVYNKKWETSYYGNPPKQVPGTSYGDHTKEPAPYTRVCLSPSSSKNYGSDYNKTRGDLGMQDSTARASSRSYRSTDWDDRENDVHYTKRAKLDMDIRSDKAESYDDQSLKSLGINTAGLPEELLRRIKGKDLFTASAIISEYSERHSGK